MSIELERAAIERAREVAQSTITDLQYALGIVPAFRATMLAVAFLDALDRIDARCVAREQMAQCEAAGTEARR